MMSSTGVITHNRSQRASYSRHAAVCWLIEQGYQVFTSAMQQGVAELVAATANGEVHLIDVVTVKLHERRDGTVSVYTPAFSDAKRRAGVRPLYVCPAGRCSFTKADLGVQPDP